MVERREAVAAGVRGGKKPNHRPGDADPPFDCSHRDIPSDPERAGWKLDEESGLSMEVLVPSPAKTNTRHRLVELGLGGRGLKNEIDVLGLISARRVDRRACAPGEHRADARLFQDSGNGLRDGLKS
jgi:hypothetical protein